MRKFLLPVILFVLAVIAGAVWQGAMRLADIQAVYADEAAREIHRAALAVDTHIDIPLDFGAGRADPAIDSDMQVDLVKMLRGGLDAGFFIVYVEQGPLTPEGYATAHQKARHKFDAIHAMVQSNSTRISLVHTADDVLAAEHAGKLAAAIGVENAYSLGAQMEHLQEFYEAGARYISLSHFGDNQFAGSSVVARSREDGAGTGLTEKGVELIRRMNDMGIMVDVSHASTESTLQAASYSKAPIIASHSGAKAVHAHPRNLTDEEIRAIADGGGVVQVVAFDSYMRDITAVEQWLRKAILYFSGYSADDLGKLGAAEKRVIRRRLWSLDLLFPMTSVEDVVDHVDHVVEVAGIEHVGIASDFGGGGGVAGWLSMEQLPNITHELLRRGYSREDVEKVLGGNLLRVWRDVETLSLRNNDLIQ